jgi:hypothetical protein
MSRGPFMASLHQGMRWHGRVGTLGELDEAMKAARASKTGAYIEIIGGKMDMPPALASRPWPT